MKQAAQITFIQSKRRTQKIIYQPEKKSVEQAAFWHKVKVVCCLPPPFLHSVRWFEHFWRVSKCSLNYNICAVWYDDLGSIQYHKPSKYFSLSINSLLFSATMISVSSNRLKMCSNSTCESHNNLRLYLLNNNVFSYSVLYIGEHCLCSLDKMPDKIQNSFSRWLSETISATICNYHVTYWILLWRGVRFDLDFAIRLTKKKIFLLFQEFVARPFSVTRTMNSSIFNKRFWREP